MAKNDYPYDFADMSKMFADMKVPGVDWQALMESQQKNISALTEANQRLLEGAQAVFKQQSEVLQKSMTELATASQEMMKEGDPKTGAKKRLDLAKNSFEAAVANMQELADVAGKSNGEVLDVISKRADEALKEIKEMIKAKA